MLVVDAKSEVNEVRELVLYCREYLMAMRMEVSKQTNTRPRCCCCHDRAHGQCIRRPLLVRARRAGRVGLPVQMKRRTDFKDDEKKAAELAAYMTHCNLQPGHVLICLKSAMVST